MTRTGPPLPLSGTFSASETSYIEKGGSGCFHLFVHHGPKPPWAAGPIVVWVISPSGPILVGAAFPPPGVWFPVTARLPVLHSVGADIIRPSGCTALGRNEDAHEPGGPAGTPGRRSPAPGPRVKSCLILSRLSLSFAYHSTTKGGNGTTAVRRRDTAARRGRWCSPSHTPQGGPAGRWAGRYTPPGAESQ